jgi:AcrR family transcriptional regulator
VQDIANQAMVHRATFYDHFVDKYALLEYSVHKHFWNTVHERVTNLERYTAENLHLLMVAMCEVVALLESKSKQSEEQLIPMFETTIMSLVQDLMVVWLEAVPPGEPEHTNTPELTAAVISWAAYGTARHWNDGGRKEPISQFVSRALPGIEGVLRCANA